MVHIVKGLSMSKHNESSKQVHVKAKDLFTNGLTLKCKCHTIISTSMFRSHKTLIPKLVHFASTLASRTYTPNMKSLKNGSLVCVSVIT